MQSYVGVPTQKINLFKFLDGRLSTDSVILILIVAGVLFFAYRLRKDNVQSGWKNVTDSKDSLIRQLEIRIEKLEKRVSRLDAAERDLLIIETTLQTEIGECNPTCRLRRSVENVLEKRGNYARTQ